MSLAGELTKAGTPPGRLDAGCRIVMDEVEGQGHQIVASHVEFVVAAEGLDEAALAGRGREGRRGLPVLRSCSSAQAPRCTSPPASREPRRPRARRGGRTRRSGRSPSPRETLLELLDVARLAPNHHLTQPWRFRVLGPETLAALKECAGPAEAVKLDRAPTLVVASAALTGELVQDEEDVCATAAAIMLVLLAATERGLASYWRTPAFCARRAAARRSGIPDGERVLGLLHFGAARA